MADKAHFIVFLTVRDHSWDAVCYTGKPVGSDKVGRYYQHIEMARVVYHVFRLTLGKMVVKTMDVIDQLEETPPRKFD